MTTTIHLAPFVHHDGQIQHMGTEELAKDEHLMFEGAWMIVEGPNHEFRRAYPARIVDSVVRS